MKKFYQLLYLFLKMIMDRELNLDEEVDDEGNYATSRANATISRNDDRLFE